MGDEDEFNVVSASWFGGDVGGDFQEEEAGGTGAGIDRVAVRRGAAVVGFVVPWGVGGEDRKVDPQGGIWSAGRREEREVGADVAGVGGLSYASGKARICFWLPLGLVFS
jgi:hypothetical protein